MIRISDALTLSITKLKTRRVRLIVTTVVSGLFFVVLAFSTAVFNGSLTSIENFSQDGFGSRYITRLDGIGAGEEYKIYEDKTLIAQAKLIDADLIARKKAAAKLLGITYDSSLEQLSVVPGGINGAETLTDTPQVQELLRQARVELSSTYFASIDKAQSEFVVVERYNSVGLSSFSAFGGPPTVPIMMVIKDGKELDSTNQSMYSSRGISSISNGISTMSDPVLEVFTLPEQSLQIESSEVPVIAPYSAAEEILGLGKLPATASSEARLDRLKEVREKVAGKTFEICLRNQASIDRQNNAAQQLIDIETNKNKKGYVRPELITEKSSVPCQDVVVTRDVRTNSVKREATKQEEFERQFGKQDPQQRLVMFKIVGVVSDPPEFGGFSVKSLVTSLLTSNLGSGWFIPESAQPKLPEYSSAFEDAKELYNYNNGIYFELANVAEAKRLVEEKSCDLNFFNGVEPIKFCEEQGTPFFLSSFGSNSIALEDAKNGFQKIFFRAAMVVAIVSAVVMMGTIGKVIADSRRETAVFRAIGAKRTDIAQIYILYSLMLGAIVATFAVGTGYLLAIFVNSKYSESLTLDALIAYNSSNLERQFTMVGVNQKELLGLVFVIMLAALISAIIPILTNLKRNPIKDMRDER